MPEVREMLAVVRAAGLVTVQDLGRPGRMHEALPPGGALVPELLIAANRAVRNPDGAPALEVLGRLIVRADAAVQVAIDRCGGPLGRQLDRSFGPVDRAHALRAGDELVVDSEPRRVAYLAVRGGIAAPLVLGGRGTQLSAGLGRALRPGDRLALAGDLEVESADGAAGAVGTIDNGDRITVVPGPDGVAFGPDALAVLAASDYRILPSSDRVGTRLAGPPLPVARDRAAASRPMVRGALEVPGDGQPIVLGPEHPTTGGYPVIAVIAHVDLGRFFARRLGSSVRFAIAQSPSH